jgi:hypothetical protein
MMREVPDSVLLTASDIKRLVDERARMNAEISDIDSRRREMERQRDEIIGRLSRIHELMEALGLADRLAPIESSPEDKIAEDNKNTAESALDEGDDRRSPWPGEILRHLRDGPYQSLASGELRSQIERGPLGNMLRASDKGYYHSVRRLALRGEITKAHGRLFIPTGLRDYEAEGRDNAQFTPMVSVRKSPLTDTILAFISEKRDDVRGREIVDHLLKDARFSGPISRNNSGAYNVLSRLVKQGRLLKHGDSYRLSQKDEAPAHAEAPKSSDSGSEALFRETADHDR